MTENIMKPPSTPIHASSNIKGSLIKKKREKIEIKDFSDTSLMIGNTELPIKNRLQITRSISPSRAYSRHVHSSL